MTAPVFPSIAVDQASTKTRKNRILTAQYGNGYAQYANDGINSQYDEWELQLRNLSSTDRSTMNTFYETVGSVVWFTWTPPGDSSSKKWRIVKDTYKETSSGGLIYNISFTVQQQFDLGT